MRYVFILYFFVFHHSILRASEDTIYWRNDTIIFFNNYVGEKITYNEFLILKDSVIGINIESIQTDTSFHLLAIKLYNTIVFNGAQFWKQHEDYLQFYYTNLFDLGIELIEAFPLGGGMYSETFDIAIGGLFMDHARSKYQIIERKN